MKHFVQLKSIYPRGSASLWTIPPTVSVELALLCVLIPEWIAGGLTSRVVSI